MSMPITPATPDPQAPAAVPEGGAAPASQPAAPPAQEPTTVHPAWDKALENIPELWQKGIREQITATEAEHQKAIEQARQGSVPESWRDLYTQAQQAGLSPDDFVNSYNGQQQLYQALQEDPDQFLADIQGEIDRQVAAGQLSRKAGERAKAQAESDVEELLTPEQQELQELRSRLDQRDQREQQQQLTAQQQQIQDQANDYAEQFVDTVMNYFDADPNLAGAGAQTRNTVAVIASSLIDADTTGTLTFEQATHAAMNQLRESVGLQQLTFAQAQQQAAGAPNPAAAIGGGTANFPAQQPKTFDLTTPEGRDQRDEWLVGEAKRLAQG